MKREMLIITVLIGNIAFAAPLPVKNRMARDVETNRSDVKKVFNAVSRYLADKGLEHSAVSKKVAASLQGDEYTNSLMIKNILDCFNDIQYEDVIAYLGESALFEKKVDLSNSDDIIALLQRKSKVALQEDVLNKAHHISTQNKALVSTSKFA